MWHLLWQWIAITWNIPNGTIWSNLFSSPVSWVAVFLGSRFVVRVVHKHHDEKEEQAQQHHDEHMKKLEEIHDHIKSTLPTS